MLDERPLARRFEVVGNTIHEAHETFDLPRLGACERLRVKVAAVTMREPQSRDEFEHALHREDGVLGKAARDEETVAPAAAKCRHEEARKTGGLERAPGKVALRAHRAVVASEPAGVREEDAENPAIPDPRHDQIADVDPVERAFDDFSLRNHRFTPPSVS